MVERTVQTEVLETVEESVTFCDSCGDPADDPEVVFTGDPDEIYDKALRTVKNQVRTEVGDLTHRTENIGMVGSRKHSQLTTPTIKDREFHAEEVWTIVNQGLDEAGKKGYTGGLESYHVCDTCKRGLNDTETALAARTAGSMAEEQDQKESTGPTFTEDCANEISFIAAIMAMVIGSLICMYGPWILGVPFLLGAIPIQLGVYTTLK